MTAHELDYETIRDRLLHVGWSLDDIHDAFAAAESMIERQIYGEV